MRARFYAFLLLLAPLAAGSMTLAACDSNGGGDENATVTIVELVIGTGAVAVPGSTARVDYIGTFQKTGAEFDRGTFSFTLGARGVIAGFDQGVEGMKVGGRRRVTVPPSLGYGKDDYNGIPGNSTLVFDITLVSVTTPTSAR